MGAAAFEYKELFRVHGVQVFSSNFAFYGDMSRRVMQTLEELTPGLEIYSVDEAFFALTEAECSSSYLSHVRSTVKSWTGIPLSIGLSHTKTLAKVAGDLAKKSQEGIKLLLDSEEIKETLKHLPVEEVWGIGRGMKKTLHKEGIFSALSLIQQSDTLLRRLLSIVGQRTVWELRGTPCIEMEEAPSAKQSILVSRSFGQPVTTLSDLEEAITTYAAKSAEKVRAQETLASFLQVFIETSHHSKEAYYSNSATATLPEPTAYTPYLVTTSKALLRAIFREGHCYKRAGVLLGELVPEKSYQRDLFAPNRALTTKQTRLMEVVDALNSKKKQIRLANEKTGSWQGKKDFLTPRYTTCWDELPLVP